MPRTIHWNTYFNFKFLHFVASKIAAFIRSRLPLPNIHILMKTLYPEFPFSTGLRYYKQECSNPAIRLDDLPNPIGSTILNIFHSVYFA